jgi:hypothetical protein
MDSLTDTQWWLAEARPDCGKKKKGTKEKESVITITSRVFFSTELGMEKRPKSMEKTGKRQKVTVHQLRQIIVEQSVMLRHMTAALRQSKAAIDEAVAAQKRAAPWLGIDD